MQARLVKKIARVAELPNHTALIPRWIIIRRPRNFLVPLPDAALHHKKKAKKLLGKSLAYSMIIVH
jgi:hypothetical protein